MRVFVTGTGRCGTTTFSKACSIFKNLTCSHESQSSHNNLKYKDNHIEVDPRLFWHLPNLIEKYPDALFIHLQRDRESCVGSLEKRPSLKNYALFTEAIIPSTYNRRESAEKYYDFCTKFVDCILTTAKNSRKITLIPTTEVWKDFCSYVGEEEMFDVSYKYWTLKYNKS